MARRKCAVVRAAAFAAVLFAGGALAGGPARAEDRHAGYYYPPPATSEVYVSRALPLAEAGRNSRLAFVIGLTQQMMSRPYAPTFAIFAKGGDAEKLIIVGLQDGRLNTLYRARALFAMLTSVARTTRFLSELGVADFFTFFDLAKLLGFTQITVSDGADFAHQVIIK